MPAQAQGQDRHAKRIGGVDPGLAEREKFVKGQTDFGGEAAEIFAHHFARERIVACRHRRVSGENVGRRSDLKGGVKTEFLFRDEPPNPLEAEKGGVAFVHVENVRLDSERAQSVDAADTEHNLLSHSHFEVATVKLGGDESIFRVVLRNIGVEQVKFDATDLKLPNASVHIAVQNRHRHQCAIVAPDFPDRKIMKILIETDHVLDPVLVDFLPEISVSIEQADGDKIQVE